MRFLILLVFYFFSNLQLTESRCPIVAFEKDKFRWVFPRRNAGERYDLFEPMNSLNKHAFHNKQMYIDLFRATNAKQTEISPKPLSIMRLANEKLTEVYEHVVEEKLFDLAEPVYKLFNISRQVTDQVSNATMFSLLMYKQFSKFIQDHTDYQSLWFQNAFADLMEETENKIEHYWDTESPLKQCAKYSFGEGFKIAEELYDDYANCAAEEMNKTDEGINKFISELTNFEKEVHEGLYVTPMKCIQQRLKEDPIACLNSLHSKDLAAMMKTPEIREAAKTARDDSVKRHNQCASVATLKSLNGIKRVYANFVLCYVAEHKKRECFIKGINKVLLHLFEIGLDYCPAVKGALEAPASCTTCGK